MRWVDSGVSAPLLMRRPGGRKEQSLGPTLVPADGELEGQNRTRLEGEDPAGPGPSGNLQTSRSSSPSSPPSPSFRKTFSAFQMFSSVGGLDQSTRVPINTAQDEEEEAPVAASPSHLENLSIAVTEDIGNSFFFLMLLLF